MINSLSHDPRVPPDPEMEEPSGGLGRRDHVLLKLSDNQIINEMFLQLSTFLTINHCLTATTWWGLVSCHSQQSCRSILSTSPALLMIDYRSLLNSFKCQFSSNVIEKQC